MAERMKDDTDRALETAFRFEPIDDDGFSARVVSRVRRRIWIRRLGIPAALALGAIIGLKPLLESAVLLLTLVAPVQDSIASSAGGPLVLLPEAPTLLLGGMLAASALMIGRMLEE